MNNNTALLVIDMQVGLLNRPVLNKEEVISNVNQALNKYHAQSGLVVFARHTNESFSKINTDDWQIDSRLAMGEGDIIINKTHSSIFKEKAFLELIKGNGIDSIMVCGLVSNGCVQAACSDGIAKGLHVTLLRNAHSTWHKEGEKMIEDWNTKLALKGVQVILTAQALEG